MGLATFNWTRLSKCCSPRCARVQATERLLVAFVFPVIGVGFGVGILVRGDVVDAEVVFLGVERAPILVGVVEAGDRALLDRAFRLVALFALGLALVLGRR